MSMVDSNQSLNNILDKLGIQPQEQKKRADGGALGQEDFLKLHGFIKKMEFII